VIRIPEHNLFIEILASCLVAVLNGGWMLLLVMMMMIACLLPVYRCSGFLFRKVGKPAALAVAGSVVVLQVSLTA